MAEQLLSGRKQRIQQLPIPSRKNHDTILNSTYLTDIPSALQEYSCTRAVLVHSKALDANTSVIKDLQTKLGSTIVATKSGVAAHSPYEEVLAITKMLYDSKADCLISIGSSSYSDASKIARLLHTSLPASDLTPTAMESLVDQKLGNALGLKDPTARLILVPTSLSASEWNTTSSATNLLTNKKQHFENTNAPPDLILLDPEVAATSPRKLWLSSGVRAVDHCVETMCNEDCKEEAMGHMEVALRVLLQGLKEYKEGESEQNRKVLLDGISECQAGSRQAMMGLVMWNNSLGPSHAIGHQLGGVCGVMHGVTSCVMLAPVLRYTLNKNQRQVEVQNKVLSIFNETLGWEEKTAADAVAKFVAMLELPKSLSEVGAESEEVMEMIAERTLTDVWGGGKPQLTTKDEVMEVLKLARG